MKILVVDDKAENRYLFETLFRAQGHEVITAANGIEALEQLRKQPVDLILSDILMPKMDGYRLCRECKQDEALKDIPFVFISSAFSDEADEAFARDLGAERFIRRPIEPAVLMPIVEEIIANRGKRAPSRLVKEEASYLAEYGERLVSGLEQKIKQLENEIAERRRAEEEASRLASVVEQAGDAIVITDLEGAIVYVNPFFEQLTGYSVAEAVGQNPRILKSGLQKEEVYRDLWDTITSGQTWSGHFINRRKDGSLYHAEATIFPVKDAEGRIINYAAVNKDVTLRIETEAKIGKLARLYATLSRTNEAIVRASCRDELLGDICRGAIEHGRFALCWVGLVDEATRAVEVFCHSGREDGFLENLCVVKAGVQEGRDPTSVAIRDGWVDLVNDFSANERLLPCSDAALSHGFRGVAALPFRLGGKVIGAVTLYAEEPDFFDEDQIRLLEEMSADISFALESFEREADRRLAEQERSAALQQLRAALEDTIRLAASTLEMRDPYTAGHQLRVAQLATAIAREMNLDETVIESLYFGSLIHDIGKIAVPSEILSKTRRLTELELAIIRTHVEMGYDLVKDIAFPWPVAQMLLQHHERLDGSGYPRGLQDAEIALEARILAVADVVEAMSSHRPYRPGLGLDAALEEIDGGRGVHFDAHAVDACLRLFREKGFTLGDSG